MPEMVSPPFSIPCSISFCPHGQNSGCSFGKDSRGQWRGKIHVERDHPETMVDSLAHELGHFLALSFCLPAAMADPRVGNRRRNGNRVNRTKRILNAEIEAWELASRIRPQISEEVVEEALETYGMKWRN
jgi:hypothetical protein